MRIERLVNEYGPADRQEFLELMGKIVKRLGGQHYNAAKEKLLAGDMHSTIEILLTYYDKAYQFGLEKKKERITATLNWNGTNTESIVRELISETVN
jgi:tRNA 2-selenouridine synthase